MLLDRIIRMVLPPEDRKFLDFYFVEQAKTTHEAAILFHDIIVKNEHMTEASYVKAKAIKHKSFDINHQTVTALNQTFITPIDREDILEITLSLDKITKRILRSAINFRSFKITNFPDAMRQQAEVIMAATEEVNTCIGGLRNLRNPGALTESHRRMTEIERRGDVIFAQAIEELFSGSYDALDVIKFRGIYRDVESAMDYCHSVSDTILNVVMKNT